MHILALSGGGFRGLFTVKVLQLLRDRLGHPLHTHFDVITGTSIGGIVALGVASGKEPEDIYRFFMDRRTDIFKRNKGILAKIPGVFRTQYASDGLKQALVEFFGANLKMRNLKCPVVIPAANLTTGSPKMFKKPADPDIYLDGELSLVDVALATSAAPVYFPMHKIGAAASGNSLGTFSDGALVGNAPGLFGLLEASTYLGAKVEDCTVLAVGTLGGAPNVGERRNPALGVNFWMNPLVHRNRFPLVQTLIAQQEALSHFVLGKILQERYYRIDKVLSNEAADHVALDDVSDAAARTLESYGQQLFALAESDKFIQRLYGAKGATP